MTVPAGPQLSTQHEGRSTPAVLSAGGVWLDAVVELEPTVAVDTGAGPAHDWGGRILDYADELPHHIPVHLECVDGRRGFIVVHPRGRFVGITPLHAPDFI